jgi:hypothetical protein
LKSAYHNLQNGNGCFREAFTGTSIILGYIGPFIVWESALVVSFNKVEVDYEVTYFDGHDHNAMKGWGVVGKELMLVEAGRTQ